MRTTDQAMAGCLTASRRGAICNGSRCSVLERHNPSAFATDKTLAAWLATPTARRSRQTSRVFRPRCAACSQPGDVPLGTWAPARTARAGAVDRRRARRHAHGVRLAAPATGRGAPGAASRRSRAARSGSTPPRTAARWTRAARRSPCSAAASTSSIPTVTRALFAEIAGGGRPAVRVPAGHAAAAAAVPRRATASSPRWPRRCWSSRRSSRRARSSPRAWRAEARAAAARRARQPRAPTS